MARTLKEGINVHQRRTPNMQVRGTVEGIIADVKRRGDDAVREVLERFDGWSPQRFCLLQEESVRVGKNCSGISNIKGFRAYKRQTDLRIQRCQTRGSSG